MNRCDDHESLITPAASRSVETRKSVVFVTRKWPPAIGGMETYSLRLSEELAKLANVRTIALPGRPDGGPPSALRLVWFGVAAAARLLTTRRAADDIEALGRPGPCARLLNGIAFQHRARAGRWLACAC